jgi:acetone carboxylase, gamma subunit
VKKQMTEYLIIDLESLEWQCSRCGQSLGHADKSYKEGCLVAVRSPTEIWQPIVEGRTTLTYDQEWVKLVEFYCPGCACMIEVEMLPPGHPISHDIELDLNALKNSTSTETEPSSHGDD